MRKNNLAYLLNEQCLCLWPSSVYWWATWIRGLHFVTKTWRYRLCKNKNKLEFTLYQDACIIISQTAWYIVVLIQWNTFFKERFPAYANIKKKPSSLGSITTLGSLFEHFYIQNQLLVYLTFLHFLTTSTLFITCFCFLQITPPLHFDNWKDYEQSDTCSLMIWYNKSVVIM